MKRYLIIGMIILMTLSIGGCKNKIINSNTISAAKLTDRERILISSASDKYFVYDFNVDNTYNQVAVWIEKYEFGKPVGEVGGKIYAQVKDRGMITFTTTKTTTNTPEYQYMFNISISSDGGMSSTNSLQAISESGEANFTSIWGNNEINDKSIMSKMVLADICYSKNSSMQSLTKNFYDDAEGNLEEIKAYDVVYLLKCEFLKQ